MLHHLHQKLLIYYPLGSYAGEDDGEATMKVVKEKTKDEITIRKRAKKLAAKDQKKAGTSGKSRSRHFRINFPNKRETQSSATGA